MNPNMYLTPGPRDDTLLYLGDEHRARYLFLNPEAGEHATLDFKRGDGSFWELVYSEAIVIPPKVSRYISLFGLGGVFRCVYRRVDRALLEALTERWRPETNTFHLPFGEATVTLEDVNILWGLPIEGMPVTGAEGWYTGEEEGNNTCRQYLGFAPTSDDFKKQSLKLSKLLTFMIDFPVTDESTDEQCIQRARCICLIMISNNILADTNNGYISLHLLRHLTNINVSGQLSWGSATLACLYRELCKGTRLQTKAVGGPMILLQMWAWTRITTLAPTIVNDQIDWRKPYGARWMEHQINTTQAPSHVLKAHRTTLQNLREADFDWMPYRRVMDRLPQMCKTGVNSWRSQCFLIYWNVVEYHPVERVMRQFGFLQDVPAPLPLSRQLLTKLRRIMRKGRLDTDWSDHHAAYVGNWNQRHEFVVEGVPTNTPTAHPAYNDWFHRHTVLYIKDPRHVPGVVHTGFDDHGGSTRYLVDGLGFIGQEAIRMRNMGAEHYYENLIGVQGMASQLIGSINHIDHPSYIQTHEPGLRPDDTIPRHAPRARGRRGRQRNRVNLVHDDDEGGDTQHLVGPTTNYGEGTSNYIRETPNYGEGTSHVGGATANYGEGTSNYRRETPNYGEGTSHVGGATVDWQAGYRPSFQDVGQGSSSNWASSLFDYTTPSSMIPAMYSDQPRPFQNYDYSGLSIQQPRYQDLSPVQMSFDLQMTPPTEPGPPYEQQEQEPRRVQPQRHPRPVGCGTSGCLRRYPHRH